MIPSDSLRPGLVVSGLDPHGLACLRVVNPPTGEARSIVYEDSWGNLHKVLLYPRDMEGLAPVQLEEAWPYDPPAPSPRARGA